MRISEVVRTVTRIIVPLLVLGVMAVEASAQTNAQDEGTFEILVNGRPAGTEEFTIRQTGVGSAAEFVATGRVQVLLPTGRLDLTTRLRASGFQADPVTYEATTVSSAPRRMIASIGGGRVSARTVTPSGEQLREYLASEGAVVLDEGVMHQYYFLVRRTRGGRVPVLIPRENRQVMAQVTDLGESLVNIQGVQVSLYQLSVQPDGGDERRVWTDALGRVIRVEIPALSYVAVRTELPR
ncbi:MAG: hypothetical protein LBG44_08740 [Gemmatimonadota bacterium]|jgi:hypothetical protein|nr:hypothetical protein [Gemmatimonadota bacterium]